MPFPWKKVKSARISQLVNDHLHISQKRRGGSSLVVETGFPTSLIDLFFKNREKLKKPSKRKRRGQGQSITPSDEILGSPISCPNPPPPPPPSPSIVGSPIPPRYSSILPPPPSCVDEVYIADSCGGDGDGAVEERRGGDSGGGDDSEVLLAVTKVFVVVVLALALATKRLTVGITISAVSLLFLEYVGKHCRLISSPCAAAISAARRCVRFFRWKEPEPPRLQQERFPYQEIQPVESAAPVGIPPEKEALCNYPEPELLEMAMKREADPNKKSKKAKLKSKMQKIFPNKFRRSRKDQELQTPSLIKDEEADQSDIGSVSSSSVSNGSCRLSDAVNEEADTKIEDKGGVAEAALARKYMLLLCLIVLVGLIGGRPFALALTSSWLLLVKLGQKLQPRSIKLPMISC